MLGVAIAGDLGLLGWFKYYGFFVQSVSALTDRLGVPAPLPLLGVALPIGISFFTFQAISYVIDVKRGRCEPVKFLDFALYLSFFPHVIAGPIVRVTELVPQFASARNPQRVEAVRAFGLISGGLLKKVLIADPIATGLVDPVFGSPSLHSRADVIAATYGYAVQIYCDFSAYTDMAISRMREIVAEIAERWPEARVAMAHRTGRLEVGEASVVVSVSCPHRAEAFEACRWGIDRLKESVPIWKKEFGESGAAWIEGPDARTS